MYDGSFVWLGMCLFCVCIVDVMCANGDLVRGGFWYASSYVNMNWLYRDDLILLLSMCVAGYDLFNILRLSVRFFLINKESYCGWIRTFKVISKILNELCSLCSLLSSFNYQYELCLAKLKYSRKSHMIMLLMYFIQLIPCE